MFNSYQARFRVSVSLHLFLFVFALPAAVDSQAQIRTANEKRSAAIGVTELATSHPTPYSPPGNDNTTCANLNASSDPRVAHITSNMGMKIDLESPQGTFHFLNGGGVEMMGGAPAEPYHYVQVSTLPGNKLNWSSSRLITAVIVKGGREGSNIYPYNPVSMGGPNGGGHGLQVPTGQGISHVIFCYEQQVTPSAADTAVSGRVVRPSGIGIAGAMLTLTDNTTGETRTVMTNPFGYYKFEGLEAGGFYFVTISHKRHAFVDSMKSFTLHDDLTNLDFVSIQ